MLMLMESKRWGISGDLKLLCEDGYASGNYPAKAGTFSASWGLHFLDPRVVLGRLGGLNSATPDRTLIPKVNFHVRNTPDQRYVAALQTPQNRRIAHRRTTLWQ